jgi:hypothetical protein
MGLHYAMHDAEVLPCGRFDRFRREFLLHGKREEATLSFENNATFLRKMTMNDTGRHNRDKEGAGRRQKGDFFRLMNFTVRIDETTTRRFWFGAKPNEKGALDEWLSVRLTPDWQDSRFLHNGSLKRRLRPHLETFLSTFLVF